MNETLASWTPRMLSVLRIFTALELLDHGTAKHLGFPVVPHYAHLQHFSLTGVAGLFELFGGFLLLIGLFTRPVAFVMSGFTAVAYFMVHFPKSFFPILSGGELSALFSFICIYFVFSGPGPISVDAWLARRKQREATNSSQALRHAA
jgi:putative oxidoreductase